MPPILDKPVSWRRSDARSRRAELTPEEQANVRKALGVLRIRLGSQEKLAKAMGIQQTRLASLAGPSARKRPGAAIALYASRVAGVPVEDILSGAFPAPGACPMCGRVTEAP